MNNFLYSIANPKSIAFFGASNRFSSMGTNQLNSVLDLGFEGNVYPVHPKEESVLGLKAYKRVADLPEIPDLAVMVLPTQVVPGVMEECGKKGIKHAVVVSGGFKEVGGAGLELEKKLLAVANQYGIRFLGPNCLGSPILIISSMLPFCLLRANPASSALPPRAAALSPRCSAT